jgi:hypothetical protein
MNTKYSNSSALGHTVEHVTSLLKELGEDVLAAHLLEVQGVHQVLAEKAAVYKTMSSELVAETIWQVFLDARECLSHLGPMLPESTLYTLRHYIRSWVLIEGDDQLPHGITT